MGKLELHPSVRETLERLEQQAPGCPLLALGQTVFWDEPLKACLPILAERVGKSVRLIAGVHDTDYFAKLPGGVPSRAKFVALPRNDGSTKGFWSSAAEFSALFGGETPVTREALAKAGVPVESLLGQDSRRWDQETEAWGWRGIALSEPTPKVTSDISVKEVFPVLQETFRWAMRLTMETLCEEKQRHDSEEMENRFNTLLCDKLEACEGYNLPGFYECLLPDLHQIVAGKPVEAEITRTTKLLKFTPETASLLRFQFLNLFLDPKTASKAKEAYNEAVAGSEIYSLEKFGTGAIPFDLVIPKVGRGTLRVTEKNLVVMTPTPQFITLKKPLESVVELSSVLFEKFGETVLIGKAITLISMLAKEFVFAFHESASMYAVQTRKMHNNLVEKGIQWSVNPILRIAHETWSALDETDKWFALPEPFRRPFGAQHVTGHTIAKAWRCVVDMQNQNLAMLSEAKGASKLIETLQKIIGGRWETLAKEYEQLVAVLQPLSQTLEPFNDSSQKAVERLREIRKEWLVTETKMGDHFRANLFQNQPSKADETKRKEYAKKIADFRDERAELRRLLNANRVARKSAEKNEQTETARRRIAEITREAELVRLTLVKESIISSKGLERANSRPSAWWLPLISPDGAWFERMLSLVQLRLEPLTGETA